MWQARSYGGLSSAPGKTVGTGINLAGAVSALSPSVLPEWWDKLMAYEHFETIRTVSLVLVAVYWFAMWALKPDAVAYTSTYKDLGFKLSRLNQQALRKDDSSWELLRDEAQMLADQIHGFDPTTADAASTLIRCCYYASHVKIQPDDKAELQTYARRIIAPLCKGRGASARGLKKLEPALAFL